MEPLDLASLPPGEFARRFIERWLRIEPQAGSRRDALPVPAVAKAIPRLRPPVNTDMLARWEATLPAGQYRVIAAFVSEGDRTYQRTARAAGVSVNTVKTVLRRVRQHRPAVWAEERADIGEALARLREAEQERDAAVAEMNQLLAELGYAATR